MADSNTHGNPAAAARTSSAEDIVDTDALSANSSSNEKKLPLDTVQTGGISSSDAQVLQTVEDDAQGVGQNGEQEVKRLLKPRQISMIAIGGAIGTGLVIGTGSALQKAGPGSLFISYSIMGFVCFMVMCALGELSTYIPHKRGFAGHATRFVEPSFGFATGMNYLFKYLLISPNQLVAAGLVIKYWRPGLSSAIFISIFIVAIIGLNLLGVKYFGEVEFWLSLIKIITLTGLILASLIIDLGGSPTGDRIGFRYWENGRAFLEYKGTGSWGRFLGFWSTMVNALFAYMGTELVGVTVGEAADPRRSVPRAIRSTFFRILFFYIIGVLLVGMVVASDSPLLINATKKSTSAAASPFVVAIQAAQIRVLPSIINAAILIFTLSAANSDLYIGSRTLYGLAMDGHVPRIFRRCNGRGVPYMALAFCSLFTALAYMSLSAGGAQTFNYFVSTVTIFGGLTWMAIVTSHIRFIYGLRAQGMNRDDLPYKAPLGLFGSYFALIFTGLVVLTKGFDSMTHPFNYKSFITNYIGLPVVAFLYVAHKFWTKSKFIKASEMDLLTGAREYNEADEIALKLEEEKRAAWKAASIKDKVVMYIKDW